MDAFLERSGGVAPEDNLYAIRWAATTSGMRSSPGISGGGPVGAGVILGAANQSIEEAINRLYGAGARNFLVWRAPNVGLTPAIRGLGQTAAGLAGIITVDFNVRSTARLANSRACPGSRSPGSMRTAS